FGSKTWGYFWVLVFLELLCDGRGHLICPPSPPKSAPHQQERCLPHYIRFRMHLLAAYTADLQWNRVSEPEPSGLEAKNDLLGHQWLPYSFKLE
ncbi:hypothetical protein AVEN_33204-1, partial [Araneus ventricosus]